jgi:hypothetical protein
MEAGAAERPVTGRLLVAALSLLLAGCSSSHAVQVSDTPAGAFEASLTPFRDGFVAAWYDTRDGHGEIYARRLSADGAALAPERRLTVSDAEAYEADVAPLRDGFAVAWYEKAKHGQLTAKVGAWSPDGTSRWVHTLSSHGRNTVVRVSGGLLFAAWIEDEADHRAGVWVTWRRADNVELIPPRRIADAGASTYNLNAVIDPDASPGNPRAWVVFDARAGTKAEEVFLVETEEAVDHVVRLTPDDGEPSKYPDVALSQGRAAITWFDMKDGNEEVYLTIGERSAYLSGRPPAWVRITSSSGHSIGAYIAWNGTRFGLAWCDNTPGNQEVYFQSFDRDGGTKSDVTRVTRTNAQSGIPAIKPVSGGFALLWNEYEASGVDTHGTNRPSQLYFEIVH